MHACTNPCTYMHGHMHEDVCTCIPVRTHVCMHQGMHVCMSHMHACTHACMDTCTEMCMHQAVHAYQYTHGSSRYMYACMHTCLQGHMHGDVHEYIHICMEASSRTSGSTAVPCGIGGAISCLSVGQGRERGLGRRRRQHPHPGRDHRTHRKDNPRLPCAKNTHTHTDLSRDYKTHSWDDKQAPRQRTTRTYMRTMCVEIGRSAMREECRVGLTSDVWRECRARECKLCCSRRQGNKQVSSNIKCKL